MRFLREASRRTPASTENIEMIMSLAAKGYGGVYLIYLADKLVGATYILSYDTDNGKVLSPVLLGGIKINNWKDDYFLFITDIARSLCNPPAPIRYIGREGWAKVFPMCKPIGTVYEFLPPLA